MRHDGPSDRKRPSEPTLPADPRRALRWCGLALVLALALGVRLVRLEEVRAAPDFNQPAVDAGFHDWWARSAVGLPTPGSGRDEGLLERAYLRPPGYPLALSGIYALTDGSHLAARWFQLGLGLAAALLMWWILLRAAGPGAACIGGAAMALHWLPLYFEGELQATALTVALLLLGTGIFQGWAARPTGGRAFALGLTLGLAAIVRPNALFVLAAAGILGLVHLNRSARPRGRATFVAWLSLGAALAILPVSARNLKVSGEPVLISTNAGINLFIGNNERATGRVAAHLPGIGPFETCFDFPELVRRVEKRAGEELSDAEVSRWFSAKAWDWIASEPGAALALLGRKTLMLLGPAEVAHNKELALERSASRILPHLPFAFPWLLAGGLVGLICCLKRPKRDPLRTLGVFSAAATGAWLASVLPFFVAARYRVPVLPWLIVLSSLALAAGWRARQGGRPEQLVKGALGWLALSLLCSVPYYRPEPNTAKWHHDRGSALIKDGRPEAALAELDAALAADPERYEVDRSRANALVALGRTDEAVRAYRRVIERKPKDHAALNNLAVVLAEGGRLAEAVPFFERALERHPSPGSVHLNLGRALEGLRRTAEAQRHFARAAELLPGNREAQRALRRLDSGTGAGAVNPPGSSEQQP